MRLFAFFLDFLITLFTLLVTENDELRTISTSLSTDVDLIGLSAELTFSNAGLREGFKVPFVRALNY